MCLSKSKIFSSSTNMSELHLKSERRIHVKIPHVNGIFHFSFLFSFQAYSTVSDENFRFSFNKMFFLQLLINTLPPIDTWYFPPQTHSSRLPCLFVVLVILSHVFLLDCRWLCEKFKSPLRSLSTGCITDLNLKIL